MVNLLTRRAMMTGEAEEPPVPYGNAMTASEAAWYNTPILMPSGHKVVIECKWNYSQVTTSGYNFFYFPNSANNGNIGRSSNNKNLRYRFSTTSGYYSDTGAVLGNNDITKIELGPIASKLLIVTYGSGLTSQGAQSNSASWIARTGTDTLRMHLCPNFWVKRIRQYDSSENLVHDIIPAKEGEKLGFIDQVTETFYDRTDGKFSITTI